MPVSQYPAAIPGNTPQALGYAEVTATQTGITTMTTITGLSVTVNVRASRRIRVTAYLPEVVNNTLNQGSYARIREDGVIVGQGDTSHGAATHGQQLIATVIRTPAEGAHTYTVEIAPQGSGTVIVGSYPAYPSYLLVEDITGVAIPVSSSSVPVGQLGYTTLTDTAALSDLAIVPGLSLNIAVPTGRVVKVTFHGQIHTSAASGWLAQLLQDGAVVGRLGTITTDGAEYQLFDGSAILSPSAGAHVYTVQLDQFSGSGTADLNGAVPNYPIWLLAEDITPTPALASGSPSSTLAYAEITANVAGSGSAGVTAPITGLSVTVNVPAGRRLRITGKAGVLMDATAGAIIGDIAEGGVSLGRWFRDDLLGGGASQQEQSIIVTPAAGTHTYYMQAVKSAGAGSYTILGSVTNPAYIFVEDVTGVSYNYTQPGLLPVNSSSRPSGPQIGAVIYEYDTGKTKIWNGAAWKDLAGGGSSLLAFAQVTSPQVIGTGTANTDLTGLSVTVNLPPGRTIRITGHAIALSGNTGDRVVGYIMEGGTYLGRYGQADIQQAGGYELFDGSAIISPTAGLHTYKLTMQKYGGAGNTQTDVATDRPAFIMVEDLTGSTLPVDALSVPVGQLGYAYNFAHGQTATSTTWVDMTSGTVNVTVPAGRSLRITGRAHLSSNIANDRSVLAIREGSTVLGEAYMLHATASYGTDVMVTTVVSPSAGAHTYVLSFARNLGSGTITVYSQPNDSFTSLLVEDITPTPAPANTAPSSTLAYAEKTTNQTGISTEVDLTGLAVTVTVSAGRRLRLSAVGYYIVSAGNARAIGRFKEGSTELGRWADYQAYVAGAIERVAGSVIISPSAGTHTYKLTTNATAGTVDAIADPTYPAYILVEDISSVAITNTVVPGALVVTSSSRPTLPAQGTTVYETDTGRSYTWSGSAWGDPAGDSGWQTPTLLNGWLNYGAAWQVAGYRRIGDVVYIRGLVKSGTSNTEVFTLPVGYRPPGSLVMTTSSGEAAQYARLDITNVGAVWATRPGDTWVSLNCSFTVT